MMDLITIVYAPIVGTDKASQFHGWVIYKHRAIMTYGITVCGVKKLWVDFFN